MSGLKALINGKIVTMEPDRSRVEAVLIEGPVMAAV